jgi:hypothetical protein
MAQPSVALAPPSASPHLLDGFEDPASWSVITADGVSLRVTSEPGRTGTCARLDYDFSRGSGYAIIRKRFDLALPANYRFSYAVRGVGPRNTMEFKLIDPSGDNVWWVNRRDFEFPADWSTLTLPRRKIGFAWGPAGAGKPLEKLGFIEIVVTSFNGGKGTVWLDDLTFEPLPEIRPYSGTPSFTASSTSDGKSDPRPIAADGILNWTSAPGDDHPAARVDFGQPRELGGLILEWGDTHPLDYDIFASADAAAPVKIAEVRGSNGGRDYIPLPDATARLIEVRIPPAPSLREGAGGRAGLPPRSITLHSFRVMPSDFGDSPNTLLNAVAADAPLGRWPRYLRGQASYWTIVGVDVDEKEALISEDGAIEVDKLAFSLEPFVYEKGELSTWADGVLKQSLEDNSLPIPSVLRSDRGLTLATTAYAAGTAGHSDLYARYELRNTGDTRRAGKLFIAIRPMQVNPTYQNLNITGGAAPIRHIQSSGGRITVDHRLVIPLAKPDALGASAFDGGEIIEHLATGHVPSAVSAEDPRALCSAALEYAFDLAPGESRIVTVQVPFYPDLASQSAATPTSESGDRALADTRAWWRERLGRVTIRFPKAQQHIADSVRANLAYILINRDGAGLQPGSRCYERTWIRDGALTSSALLAMGLSDEVRAFLDWFAPFQYDNGKIPCCVDRRGPDPVPEHDSHGEYIAAVHTYFQFTGDSDFLRRHWPRVLKAVEYIEFLRAQRMTDEFAKGPDDKKVLYGLMPESISHEGYSAKPMHSYWDDFWTLKGLRDAADIASLIGDAAQADRLGKLRDSFAATLNDSITLAVKLKNISYIPGCAELGDFDATSTTVSLFPCDWNPGDLRPLLDRTFDRYWTFFQDRRDGRLAWKDYTPYEHRVVGSMVLLGHRDRAIEMLDFFFKDQRPAGWGHWAEVVRPDPREQGYIGDMPHTWVGSDFINSVRVMLAYTRQPDAALIIGAGLPQAWIDSAEGVSVENLVTEWGKLSFEARSQDGAIRYQVRAPDRAPRGGVWVSLPDPARLESMAIDGKSIAVPPDGLVRLPSNSATLTIKYRSAEKPAP